MRLMATAGALVLTTAIRAYALVQDKNIAIRTDHHDEWYAQPVWTAIGIIALVLILVLIARADRRSKTPPRSV